MDSDNGSPVSTVSPSVHQWTLKTARQSALYLPASANGLSTPFSSVAAADSAAAAAAAAQTDAASAALLPLRRCEAASWPQETAAPVLASSFLAAAASVWVSADLETMTPSHPSQHTMTPSQPSQQQSTSKRVLAEPQTMS